MGPRPRPLRRPLERPQAQLPQLGYGLKFEHAADLTERDTLRAQASYFSDSWFRRDFYRNEDRGESIPVNEVAYEHRELDWASGVSASGPLNDFYSGTARLPEGWFAVNPQPIWDLPVNYESQTRAGYLNRDYAEYRGASDDMFRYVPYIGPDGRAADYQAFRADSSHRVSIPFKLWDVLSVVPRATYHGTYWSDSGSRRAFEDERSKASGDGIYRNIAEFGFTAAARGSAWLDDAWRHTIEPYLDYSYQVVDTTSSRKRQAYVFDGYDGATEWLDQFGFEGRGLPYNWHGVRPGIRNLFQKTDEHGIPRTVFDADLYAAIPFASYSHYTRDSWMAGYPKDSDDPHYSHSDDVVPGIRLRYAPTKNVTFLTRNEYDARNDKAAYSDIFMRHRLADNFSWHAGYIGRDHRNWDYVPSIYDRRPRRLRARRLRLARLGPLPPLRLPARRSGRDRRVGGPHDRLPRLPHPVRIRERLPPPRRVAPRRRRARGVLHLPPRLRPELDARPRPLLIQSGNATQRKLVVYLLCLA